MPEAHRFDLSRAGRDGRAAAWVFGIAVLVAYPLLLLELGDHFWFFRDDWFFITERELSSVDDLFSPHNGHWSTGPIVVFRLLYAVFGIKTYLPYQAVVVATHLAVVVLIRIVMRRADVRPWVATAVAGSAILFGPGREDIIWAFQMGFTGSIMFGLLQLVLADHEGPIGRRDVLAVLAGLAGIITCSPAIPVIIGVGLAILLRRGWKAAAVQTAPLGAIYVVWMLVAEPSVSTPFGRPSVGTMFDWVRSGEGAVFAGLGHYRAVTILLPILLVVGVTSALLIGPRHPSDEAATSAGFARQAWSRLVAIAGPVALYLASLVFMLMSVQNRWFAGPDGARASRYLYLYVVLTLPLVAVAAEAMARRARVLGAVIPVLLLVAVPANAGAFDDPPWGPGYHERQEALITNAVRLPIAGTVDPDARPIVDPYLPSTLDMGFLLHALHSGKLSSATGPFPPALRGELVARLSLMQRPASNLPAGCDWLDPSDHIAALGGTELVWDSAAGPIRVREVDDGTPADGWTEFDPRHGTVLEVSLDGATFDWEPVDPSADIRLCEVTAWP